MLRTGAERVAEDPSLLGDGRFGLITNFTGVLPDLRLTSTALLAAGVNLVALFGPEHGLTGTAQAGESESATVDPETGLPVFDTYLKQGAELDRLIEEASIDALIFDIQDLGVRFYTYIWTMYDCLQAAARTGRRFIILDRPNPLGGLVVEGPNLQPGFESFVGRAPIPLRHGLTAGELGRQFQGQCEVVPMTGWSRSDDAWTLDQPWIPPSPNMPTRDCALVYPGMGLFEGTNLSEGRGTTRPFETIGAPYLDARLAPALRERQLPGVAFRGTWFKPVFSKYAGQVLPGVQVHVVDRAEFAPVRTALVMLQTLRELYPDDLAFRPELDRLWGSDSLRKALVAGEAPVLPDVKAPESDLLLYQGVTG
jgi:uncharacterized protein YbbC (DUF1343 family)